METRQNSEDLNVGAGLPAIAVLQWRMCWLTHRHRRQASSHIFGSAPRLLSLRTRRTQAPPSPDHHSNSLKTKWWELTCLRWRWSTNTPITETPQSQASQLPQGI